MIDSSVQGQHAPSEQVHKSSASASVLHHLPLLPLKHGHRAPTFSNFFKHVFMLNCPKFFEDIGFEAFLEQYLKLLPNMFKVLNGF